MAEWNGFRGDAKRLDDIDLPKIGHEIGVGEDEIHAVLDVESAGTGFDKLGRPRMLFEPHIFWRELPPLKRDAAAKQGLAYPKWKRNYPADSYPRLTKALAIDETAALRSASWGLGQVMGFNHKLAGFDTVDAMVRSFMDDEEAHLQAMVEFIKAANLDDELRRHDWRGFARGYNGSGYAKNAYHTKLAAAFKKWSRIRDTAWSPEGDEPSDPPVPTPAPRVTTSDQPRGRPDLAGRPAEAITDALRREGSRTIEGTDAIESAVRDIATKAKESVSAEIPKNISLVLGGVASAVMTVLQDNPLLVLAAVGIGVGGYLFFMMRQRKAAAVQVKSVEDAIDAANRIRVARADDAVTGNAEFGGPVVSATVTA